MVCLDGFEFICQYFQMRLLTSVHSKCKKMTKIVLILSVNYPKIWLDPVSTKKKRLQKLSAMFSVQYIKNYNKILQMILDF